ncbi:MAG: hypothetical protein WBQ53_14625 [Methylocystis sp.]
MQVRLIAPPGCDEANYGEHRFKVHEDGTVEVPMEAVEGLMHTGGFAPAKHPAPTPSLGFAFMRGLAGGSASWRGQAFEPNADGLLRVPQEAIADLLPHGFQLVGEA